jgi:hypothetical protein
LQSLTAASCYAKPLPAQYQTNIPPAFNEDLNSPERLLSDGMGSLEVDDRQPLPQFSP